MNSPRRTASFGFTMLELLAVIGIICLLLGLILPAAIALRRSAKQRQAALHAQVLIQAVIAYKNAYGKWPTQTQDAQDITCTNSAAIIAALTTNLVQNPRQLHFIEIPDGSLFGGIFVDPWKRPFLIAMDENADGQVDLDLSAFSESDVITNIPNESVAVASGGPDPADKSRRIYSWSR